MKGTIYQEAIKQNMKILNSEGHLFLNWNKETNKLIKKYPEIKTGILLTNDGVFLSIPDGYDPYHNLVKLLEKLRKK